MKLYIRQRVFSWKDSYDIFDEDQRMQFQVRSELFSWGHTLRIYNRDQELIGSIIEKIFNFLPKFEIEINNQKVATLNKLFSLFYPKYQLNCGGWKINGDFMGWNYRIMEEGYEVIKISKQFFAWSDVYEINIQNNKDILLGLMVVLAIDAANCDNK